MIRSSILISFFSLLISIAGFISQMLLANFFGAGYLLDIYFTLSSLPILIAALFSSALSFFLIPTLLNAKNDFGFSYGAFLYGLMSRIMGIVLVISIVGGVFISSVLLKLYNSISFSDVELSERILIYSWGTVPFTVFLGFLSCQFNANRKFFQPILLSFLPYLFSITFIWLFHDAWDILSIPIGLFVGTILATIIGFCTLLREFSFKGFNQEVDIAINKFLKRLPIAIIAMLCFTVYQSIDAFWVPKLGVSNLSYLGYCQRIIIAVGALVIIGPSTILVPRLTEAIIEKRDVDFVRDANLTIKIIFALASIIAVIGSVLASEIIQILFMRGKFTLTDVTNVAEIFPFMLIGMIFMLSVVVMFRMLFVKEEVGFVAVLGVLSLIIYFVLSGVAIYFNSLEGICFAYIFTWFTLFIICFKKIFKNNKNERIIINNLFFLLKNIMIVLVTGIILFYIKGILHDYLYFSAFTNALVVLSVGGFLGLFIAIALNIFLKQKEITFMMSSVANQFFKRTVDKC